MIRRGDFVRASKKTIDDSFWNIEHAKSTFSKELFIVFYVESMVVINFKYSVRLHRSHYYQ